MNKSIKMILVIAGIAVLGYGVYMFMVPETVVSIGSLDLVETQDNNKAYLTMVLGVLLLFIGLLGSNSKLKI